MKRQMTWLGSIGLALIIGGGLGYWLSIRAIDTQATSGRASSRATDGAAKATMKAPPDRQVLYWHDPMVPGQKFDKPGKSPFMDMQLVPVYADEAARSGVAVSPAMISSLGIRTVLARRIAVASRIDVVGSVAENERASAVVQARSAGYIEKLHARANFDSVAAGAPIALIYAPEWAGAQAEYLALRRSSADAELIVAARQRLRLLSIPDSVVESAERNDAPEVRYTLTAPRSGVVTDLAVRDGAMVTPGMTLMRIVSLGEVWVYAEIPEGVAAAVAVGANAEIRLPAYPEQVLRGRVSALLPQVNAASRTLRARVELPNPGGLLKPGMLVNVALIAAREQVAIAVPQESVIATGKRSVVIVREPDGRFRPVDVVVGRELGADIEIKQGLREGQTVVASGQFLLDSEASLKATLPQLDAGRNAAPIVVTDVAPTKPSGGRP
jgi:membrane fusion protein, copper/silver efflux system